MDEESIPCVQTEKSRLAERKVEQRKRRRELVDARCVYSVSVEALETPVFDLVGHVLRRASEKGNTWRNAIAEHVSLLSSAVGTNRNIGGKGKALVRWMADQTNVLSELWEKGVLPDKSSGETSVVVARTSGVLNEATSNDIGSITGRATGSSSSALSSRG
jgi:hypothetical protein